jgi:hypothetical protein
VPSQRLGVEHILAYSPQARGRSERINRTLQDRLVNELASAGIVTVERANRYLDACFLPAFNDEFARPPADPASGFAPLGTVDLDTFLCIEESRTVQRDNIVTLEGVRLQIARPPGRATLPASASPCAVTSTAPTPSGGGPNSWVVTVPRAGRSAGSPSSTPRRRLPPSQWPNVQRSDHCSKADRSLALNSVPRTACPARSSAP